VAGVGLCTHLDEALEWAAEASVAGPGYRQTLKAGGRRGLAFRLVCCFPHSSVECSAYGTGLASLDTGASFCVLASLQPLSGFGWLYGDGLDFGCPFLGVVGRVVAEAPGRIEVPPTALIG
jgi:hypothetical protein